MSKVDEIALQVDYYNERSLMRLYTADVQGIREKLLHCRPEWIKYYRRLFEYYKKQLRRHTERFERLYEKRYGGRNHARNTEGES